MLIVTIAMAISRIASLPNISARACIDLFPERGLLWFWLAAGSFLTATVCWATLALLPRRRAQASMVDGVR